MSIRKAVIAAAGLGTRFLPASKAVPKELMPLVDKPVIQVLVEEMIESGIEEIILVIRGESTCGLVSHLEAAPGLEAQVADKADRLEKLIDLNRTREKATLAYVPQGGNLPYGNGSPLLAAKSFLTPGDHFAYVFGDDVVVSAVPCLKQLVRAFEEHRSDGVVAVQNVAKSETGRYGIIKPKRGADPVEIESIVEKPAGDAPSTLAQFGRFILPYRILDFLEERELGKGNELWLADALCKLCGEARVIAKEVEGTWHTVGDPLRFLIANIAYALKDESIGPELARHLKQLKLD